MRVNKKRKFSGRTFHISEIKKIKKYNILCNDNLSNILSFIPPYELNVIRDVSKRCRKLTNSKSIISRQNLDRLLREDTFAREVIYNLLHKKEYKHSEEGIQLNKSLYIISFDKGVCFDCEMIVIQGQETDMHECKKCGKYAYCSDCFELWFYCVICEFSFCFQCENTSYDDVINNDTFDQNWKCKECINTNKTKKIYSSSDSDSDSDSE